MMIVRATGNLEPGTEITIGYDRAASVSRKDFHDKLKHWGFACDCAICLDDRTTEASIFKRRDSLFDDLMLLHTSIRNQDNIPTDKCERLIKAMNETYARPADEVPRLLVWEWQQDLAIIYEEQNKWSESLEAVRQVLICLGFIVVGADASPTRFAVIKWGHFMEPLHETFSIARTGFRAMGLPEDAEQADEYAKIAYKIAMGEDATYNPLDWGLDSTDAECEEGGKKQDCKNADCKKPDSKPEDTKKEETKKEDVKDVKNEEGIKKDQDEESSDHEESDQGPSGGVRLSSK